jgi:hypothetical protein
MKRDELAFRRPAMSQNIGMKIVFLTAVLSLYLSTASAQFCHYSPLNPGSGKVNVGDMSVDFGEADDMEKPRAWQGPIVIGHSDGTSCKVDQKVGIIERPIYMDGSHLLVTTYSGSERVVFAVDAKSCAVLWQSEQFVGQVSMKNNTLHVGARKMELGANCTPK